MQQWTCLFGLWHATISGIYMTTGNDQLSGWIKKELQSISQSQTCTKKRSWSLIGDLLPIWSTTAFWIPVTSLHLRSMLSKSVRCTKNCNACSKHWSTERTQLFSIITPYHMSHNQCWCTGMTQRDGMGKEVGGGFRMGYTCTPMVDSCWCMAKPIQYCKVINLQLK